MTDTPRPPMTQPEPVLTDAQKLRLLAAWFDMWDRPETDRQAILDDPRNPGRNDVQRDLHRIADRLESPVQPVPPNHPDDAHPHSWGCRRCGVDHPVQPVLSGLEEALDDIDNGAGDESHVRAVVARIRRLAATAPAAKTPPDPFDPDQRYLEDRTAPAADEGPDR